MIRIIATAVRIPSRLWPSLFRNPGFHQVGVWPSGPAGRLANPSCAGRINPALLILYQLGVQASERTQGKYAGMRPNNMTIPSAHLVDESDQQGPPPHHHQCPTCLPG